MIPDQIQQMPGTWIQDQSPILHHKIPFLLAKFYSEIVLTICRIGNTFGKLEITDFLSRNKSGKTVTEPGPMCIKMHLYSQSHLKETARIIPVRIKMRITTGSKPCLVALQFGLNSRV